MASSLYLNLDDAWGNSPLDLPRHDAQDWGKRLRYIARKPDIEAFWQEMSPRLTDFVLYGSGDFHHLAGVLIRRVRATPFTLVSFDNHPDWDVKPPYWSCGGWAARTLYTGRVESVHVWGCGNFELRWPARLSADRRALHAGTLKIHAWAQRQPPAVQRKFDCMTRENWRDRFDRFADSLAGKRVYVSVDLDGLRKEEAITNWENGLFTAADVAWAVHRLREHSTVVGSDLCGAYSPPVYARFAQRFAGNWDHPRIGAVDADAARRINLASLATISPALIG